MYIGWSQKDFDVQIKLEIEDAATLPLNAEKLDLKPGESYCYSVVLACKEKGKYIITLSFEEVEKGGLESFVDVETSYGGTVYTAKLEELLESDKSITFECEANAFRVPRIKIRYTMPADVGNEAQGKESLFNVSLTATRKL